MFNFIRFFSSPRLSVEWDDSVSNYLKPEFRGNKSATIRIGLFNLLKGLGCVQPKRVDSSLMSSLLDYGYLINCIHNTPDLKLKINETRIELSSEMLTEVSELMGIGLSVVVVSQLFNIQPSTISKIKGASVRRPDWQCLLNDNRTLLVEAKGSTNKSTSKQQIKKAITQKNSIPGDLRIATATVLKEESISSMSIKDPPVNEINDDNNLRHIYRANHYSSVFSFLGEDILSIYYEKMAKRLSGAIGEAEMADKDMMYNELTNKGTIVDLEGIEYVGHLYGPNDGCYFFIGVNKKLLSYNGFIEFQDTKDNYIEIDGNNYWVCSDGILIVNVSDRDNFLRNNEIESIKLNIDSIALSDLDSIKGQSFKRYVKYLLGKCSDDCKWAEDGALKAFWGERDVVYYIYHVRNAKNDLLSFKTFKKLSNFMSNRNGVLVTNLRIASCITDFQCVDRSDFERIAESKADVGVLKKIFVR